MANALDLITSETLATAYTPPAALSGYVATAITAASKAVQLYCNRNFNIATYDELYSGDGSSAIYLRNYPINSITRLATTPLPVLSVINTTPSINQRSLCQLVTSGDVDSGQVVTGLALTTVASGISSTSTISFSGGGAPVTIQSLATAINAVGSGWSATAASPYGLWPVSDLRQLQGNFNAVTPGNCQLAIHTTDLSGYTVDQRAGEVRLDNQTYDPVFALMNLNGGSLLSCFPPGFLNIRVIYSAGYLTVPEPIQQAVILTVRSCFDQLQTSASVESERLFDHEVRNRVEQLGLPAAARQLLFSYRRLAL